MTKSPGTAPIQWENWFIDYNKHQVRVRGENVHLTLSEFRIVALLGKYAGKVLTYDFIIKELWGPGPAATTRFSG